MSVSVVKPGLQTTIQSRPRTGLRHMGVPACGAADRLSLALANKLVGNQWDAPALEATLLGPTLRFNVASAFAITGAQAAVTLNGRDIPLHETVFSNAGDELATDTFDKGARLYIAIAGGLAAGEVMGSSSTCLLAALGGMQGRALEAGDALCLGPASVPEKLQTPGEFRPPMLASWALRACASFETNQLSGNSREQLFDTNWTVSRRADRMGLQLDGPTLDVTSDGRMSSAPVFPGTVQCPESGAPYLLSVDAGTVGGYPRIAQIARADRHLVGQLRPGDHVRLLWREAQNAIDDLRAKIEYWRQWLEDIERII